MNFEGVLFTDIDGTFKRRSMFLDILEALFINGLIDLGLKKEIDRLESLWQKRQGSFDDYIGRAVKLFEKALAGLSEQEVNSIIEQTVDEKCSQVYAFTRELIRKKRDQGWLICAISASPYLGVERFCQYWGIPFFIGTHMEVKDGFFTGKRDVVDGKRKVDFMQDLLSRPELARLPLGNVWAMGDTSGDAPMLRYVGIPIAFNPSSELLSFCRQELLGTTVVIERKDLIVEIYQSEICLWRVLPDGSLEFLNSAAKPGFVSILDY